MPDASDELPETRVAHCKADESKVDEYVGRGSGGRDMLSVAKPGQRGWLGNPFPADEYGREESIEKFREAFEDKLDRDEEFRDAVRDLAGKTLGCWCQRLDADEPACHAEVIAQKADELALRAEVDLSRYEACLYDRHTILPATCEEAAREQAASLWGCDPSDVEVSRA